MPTALDRDDHHRKHGKACDWKRSSSSVSLLASKPIRKARRMLLEPCSSVPQRPLKGSLVKLDKTPLYVVWLVYSGCTNVKGMHTTSTACVKELGFASVTSGSASKE